jgi:hypothetical protein
MVMKGKYIDGKPIGNQKPDVCRAACFWGYVLCLVSSWCLSDGHLQYQISPSTLQRADFQPSVQSCVNHLPLVSFHMDFYSTTYQLVKQRSFLILACLDERVLGRPWQTLTCLLLRPHMHQGRCTSMCRNRAAFNQHSIAHHLLTIHPSRLLVM